VQVSHADSGNARVGEVLGTGNGNAGAIGAQHHAHALADQLLRGGGGFIGRGAVIRVDQLDLVGLSADLDSGLHGVGVLHSQPAPLSPEAGSNTPIFTTPSAMAKVGIIIKTARKIARYLFIGGRLLSS